MGTQGGALMSMVLVAMEEVMALGSKKSVPVFGKDGKQKGRALLGRAASMAATAECRREMAEKMTTGELEAHLVVVYRSAERRRQACLAGAGVWGFTKRSHNFA